MVNNIHIDKIWDVLHGIPDPEIPVVSIVDLGIVRDVKYSNKTYSILITPTYNGCPAISSIKDEISQKLTLLSIENHEIQTILSPPWTTDWMSDEVKNKLKESGISPPSDDIACPQCDSLEVEVISNFGSTACKSFYKCLSCLEPFHHFKKF